MYLIFNYSCTYLSQVFRQHKALWYSAENISRIFVWKTYICMHILRFEVAGLSKNSMAAQAFVFYFGDFEKTSTTMRFCLYDLSLHQDIQDRATETWRQVYLRRNPGDGIFSQSFSGKTPFFKNITKTRHMVLNAAMSLGDLSLLHINWQSKLIIRTNHNLPAFSARELLSSLSVFCCFNFNILYRIHTAFRICILMSIHLILFYIYVTILTFFSHRLTTVRNL